MDMINISNRSYLADERLEERGYKGVLRAGFSLPKRGLRNLFRRLNKEEYLVIFDGNDNAYEFTLEHTPKGVKFGKLLTKVDKDTAKKVSGDIEYAFNV